MPLKSYIGAIAAKVKRQDVFGLVIKTKILAGIGYEDLFVAGKMEVNPPKSLCLTSPILLHRKNKDFSEYAKF